MARRIKGEIKDKIYNKALVVFAKKGYEAASVDEIVNEVGIAKGTFYYYFETKEDLFHQIIDNGVKLFSEELENRIKKENDVKSKIYKLIELEIDFFKKYRDFCLVFVTEFWNYKDRWHEDIEKIQDTYMNLIGEIIGRKNGNKEIETAMLFWTGATMSLSWQTFHPQIAKRIIIDKVFSLVWEGLREKYN